MPLSMTPTFRIEEARGIDAIAAARLLFGEYQRDLGISLDFQGFDDELRALPGAYAAPGGALLIAWSEGKLAGCVAMRPCGADEAEIKRLYVRPTWRGMGLAERLVEALEARARDAGYRALRLDTLASMAAAMRLYARRGFVETPPYHGATLPGMRFFRKPLAGPIRG
jgi:putative acetyltransferase